MIEARKKEGESSTSLLYRFSKRIKQSGILREARKRRFTTRVVNRRKRRISARYRTARRVELDRLRKLGK